MPVSACGGTGASMRPRSFERGKLKFHANPITFSRASMRPRSFERGKNQLWFRVAAGLQASMRPRSFERGKPEGESQELRTQ